MKDKKKNLPVITVTAHWAMKLLYAIGTIIFSILMIFAWQSFHSLLIPFLFGLFATIGIFTFLASFATFKVDEISLIVTAINGIHKIDWSEVVEIEKTVTDDWRYESNDITFAFIGDNKCLPINLRFASNGRDECFEFIQKQIEQRQIKIKPLSSKWLRPKNTRISRFRFF